MKEVLGNFDKLFAVLLASYGEGDLNDEEVSLLLLALQNSVW